MFGENRFDPTGRFSSLADVYARSRPSYPPDAVAWIVRRAYLTADELFVDVGSGTGISTRQLARHGLRVLGIEPNAAMRDLAEQAGEAEYRSGEAEATGLSDGEAAAVLMAQAFHWVKPQEALAEFARILRPGGAVFLMWNEWERADPFSAGFWQALRMHTPQPELLAVPHSEAGRCLLSCPLFERATERHFSHEQILDLPQLLERGQSVSYAPRVGLAAEQFQQRLRELFNEYQQAQVVRMKYRTTVFAAHKPDEFST